VNRIGVCSWSLQPSSPRDLADKVRACGLDVIQLALDPIRTGGWNERETLETLRETDITIVSGMMGTKGEDYSTLESIRRTGGVRPDEHWVANLGAAHANADIAQGLGITLVTFHAGFLPHDPLDPARATMLDRLRQTAAVFAAKGVRVALETGQESAGTLLRVLADLQAPIGVNFDPANMILYGMGDAVEALRHLAAHVAQVHIKDAAPTQVPGTWGREVVAGTGAVDWAAFFRAYHDAGLSCDLVIEREAGDRRIDDVRQAAALVRRHTGAARLR
jgi:L-ribulose-5-phosphate 3-epimerase